MFKRIFSFHLFFILTVAAFGQNSFTKEVDSIVMRNDTLWNSDKETVIFTGSSSIRFWTDVQQRFPEYHILNCGFGGSQTPDLLYHLDKLVFRYQPKQVIIYDTGKMILNGGTLLCLIVEGWN